MPKAPNQSTAVLNTLRNTSGAVATPFVALYTTAPANDVWSLSMTTGANAATGGTFTLTFGGQTTAAIAWNATAATVLAAFTALSTVGVGAATVTAANGESDAAFPGDLMQITLVGNLGLAANGAITKTDSLTGGSSPATTLTHTTTGSAGVEASGGGYARTAVAFSAPTGVSMTNSGAVNFPSSTGSGYGTVTSWGIYDAASSGNLKYYDVLTGTNDVWTLSYTFTTAPTGGTFTITLTGTSGNEIGTSSAIPWNADPLTVQSILEELAGAGNVSVRATAGDPNTALPPATSAGAGMTIAFQGALRYAAQTLAIGTSSLTGGTGSPTAALTHATTGATGSQTVGSANISVSLATGAIVLTEL